MKKVSLFLISFLLLFVTIAQIPQNYYAAADGKQQNELKMALSEIITNGYKQRTYNNLWTDFYTTDVRYDGKVWDIYSNCDFTFGVDQDKGENAQKECVKYNREHSVPNNWFGGEVYPMYSDLFHLYPTDKFINAQRADFPYGETNTTLVYGNGSKKGNGTSESGYTQMVYEPADDYKGDLARTYFYMATRYLYTNFSKNLGAVTFTYQNSTCDLTNYAINLFLKWHRNDPVSQKELDRNNAVYGIQNNRNPFIDYPELVEHIWGNLQDLPFQLETSVTPPTSPTYKITKCNGIYINGAEPNARIEIYSITGQFIYSTTLNNDYISLEHLRRGVYIIKINDYSEKIIW